MPVSILAPAIIQGVLGLIGGGLQAGAQARAAGRRRERLEELIRQVRDIDMTSMERGASRRFSEAAGQFEALGAQQGTRRAGRGGTADMQAQALGQVLGQLAEAESQRRQQAQQLEAGLLADPAFGGDEDPTLAALIGGLTGATGAAGGQMLAQTGTQEGLDQLIAAFGSIFGGGFQPQAGTLPGTRTTGHASPRPPTGRAGDRPAGAPRSPIG